jgi:hypothetical protein
MGRQFLNGVVGVVAVVLSTIGEIELAGLKYFTGMLRRILHHKQNKRKPCSRKALNSGD